MNRSMITTEFLWNARDIESIAGEWDSLYGLGRCEPSTSLEWTRALLETHVLSTDVVFTIVLREGGHVVAIAPAMIRRESLVGPLKVATLTFLSELHNTHSDVLRRTDSPDIIAALFKAFAALPHGWDIFRVGRLLESSSLALAMIHFLAQTKMAHRVRREQPSFILALDSSYEAFLASRSGKFRNYLRRKNRAVEESGQIKVLRAGRDLDLDQAYADLLSIEERSWKHAHGTAISAVPHQRLYYRTLSAGALERGRLHLVLMYLNDRPIAFDLGIKHDDRYYYLKTSFDEEFRRLSPATVLRAHLVETLIGEGVHSLDFPAEPYQWEEQWTDQLRWHKSILCFNKTPRALLFRALIGARDALRRSKAEDGIKYVDPRRLRAP
jgi:CelD/BcsL family acetyltransferase involved in cellulose biosynthesis